MCAIALAGSRCPADVRNAWGEAYAERGKPTVRQRTRKDLASNLQKQVKLPDANRLGEALALVQDFVFKFSLESRGAATQRLAM